MRAGELVSAGYRSPSVTVSPSLSSQYWQMDGSWVFYEQLGVWCNFNIPCLDSSPHPLIFGKMGKLSQISPKVGQCPYLPICHNQTAHCMKTGKYSFKRGIIALHFGVKYASLPVPIFEESWWIHCRTGSPTVTRFIIIRQMAPLCCFPSVYFLSTEQY